MTKQDFILLSQQEQEEFINNGGVFDSVVDTNLQAGVSLASPTVVCATVPDVESSGCSFDSPQPAPPSPNSIVFGSGEFDGFDIKNPLELLFLVNERIRTGKVKLHQWQIDFLLDFASKDFTKENPFQAIVRACNGSGKDRFIVAPCAVWLCMRWKKSIAVVTSSSGAQLDKQTCRYIKNLCEDINRQFNTELWNCKYREYSLDFGDGSKSYIYSYATDEPSKAEGYHPEDDGSKMAILVSEDKSVPDDINVALNKCTGYTHRVHVSTPGLRLGHFYDYDCIAIERKSLTTSLEVSATDWIKYHIRASDCTHIPLSYVKQMERDLPGGKFGSAFMSQVEAEFGTTDEMVVIPYTYIWRAVHKPSAWIPSLYNTGGLDLSDGGAETVLSIRNGNKLLKVIPFKFEDTQDTIEFLDEQFRENNLNHSEALIYADSVGMGKPMLDSLKRKGWKNVRYIDSRNTPRYPKTYLNRGSELFFNLRSLLEYNEIILVNDELLMKQLGGRYYKITAKGVHQLLSKQEQKSKGYPSPDRADSVNLCFWDYKLSAFSEESKSPSDESVKPFDIPEDKKVVSSFDTRSWATKNQSKWKPEQQNSFSFIEDEIAVYNQRLVINK